MKKLLSLILVIALISSMIITFTGCGDEEKSAKESITVFNYGQYIDPEVLNTFEDETGIHVNYEEYVSPEEMYTKYSSGGVDYDIVCSSEYMIEKMLDEGSLQKIDFTKMKYETNINKKYYDFIKSFDEKNEYAIPYFWGTVGIIYNSSMVEDDITSWNALFDDTYKGQILMQNSMRDSLIPALELLGYSLNTTDKKELDAAANKLIEQKPIVSAYLLDEIRDEMIQGNAAMGIIYSGDAYYAMEYNEDLVYVVPEEGTNIWIDCFAITKECDNYDAAIKFLDFMSREDIATKNFEEVYYATPNDTVIDSIDEDLVNDLGFFPSDELLNNSELFISLDDDTTEYISNLWKKIKS